ncbi:Multiple EGF-like-domain protein 3 precursor [Enhygromyxa salina]|uniref:Multiple EGF-like-domain protein 3 n=1 Tax=Enhygromyxa salina TaxID=215803 RepID=A0A0C1ZT88_9BACT|nr:LamG domain-containing protein [Enhygromyxa salina]KIG14233.1 Multiple EGF-like-domain protein 3 precursor [Enhygromyxa salina]
MLNPAFDERLAGEESSDDQDSTATDGNESQQTTVSSSGDGDDDGDTGDGDTGDGDGDGDDETGDGDTGDGDGDGDGSDACANDQSLIACYQFETADQVVDGSTHANHGFAAKLGLGVGVSGMALECATSEAVQVPDSASLDVKSAVTMAMWVHPQTVPQFGRDVWFDNSGQYGMMFDANVGFVCRILTNHGTSQIGVDAGVVPPGEWSHIACTYDGAMTRLYANGLSLATLSTTGVMLTGSAEPVAIGSNSPLFNERCTGKIDSLLIYDRALSDAEIGALADL